VLHRYCLVENLDVSQDLCSDMMHKYCEHNDRGKADSHSADPQTPGTSASVTIQLHLEARLRALLS
jgi:hypothetical protein